MLVWVSAQVKDGLQSCLKKSLKTTSMIHNFQIPMNHLNLSLKTVIVIVMMMAVFLMNLKAQDLNLIELRSLNALVQNYIDIEKF